MFITGYVSTTSPSPDRWAEIKIFAGGRWNTVGFLTMSGLLEARDLRKSYSRATGLLATDGHGADFMAVDGVSFSVEAGRLFAVSGKAGAARLRLRDAAAAIEPDSGEIEFDGQNLLTLSGKNCGGSAGRCR